MYGQNFVYDEMFVTGLGKQREAAAQVIAVSPYSIGGDLNFEPGDGPDRTVHDAGASRPSEPKQSR